MMSPFTRRAIILAVLMLGTSLLAVALTPTLHVTSEAEQPDLEKIIPRQFGVWKMDDRIVQAIVNPQEVELRDKLYTRILARTYFNNNGRRIMLSLAYGPDQLHDNKIHRPEVCYPAQGFTVIRRWKDDIHAGTTTLPVMRIETQHDLQKERLEPVTYWIRVGNSLVRGAMEQSFARMGYGLKNQKIPDGILVRVSEINPNAKDSFALQDQFIFTLLSAMTPTDRKVLIPSPKFGPESVYEQHND